MFLFLLYETFSTLCVCSLFFLVKITVVIVIVVCGTKLTQNSVWHLFFKGRDWHCNTEFEWRHLIFNSGLCSCQRKLHIVIIVAKNI